jgi:hypothetical protein
MARNRGGESTTTAVELSTTDNDKMNGKGVYANAEIELEGYFENDNFVRPLD